MQLSDWQLKRVRDALRAFHKYERFHDGRAYSWEGVSVAIEEYTDIAVPSERLRQFVLGINTKEGHRRHPVPEGERLAAIVTFVTHEDIALLTQAELNENLPGMQAPLRLLDYLDQAFDAERVKPPAHLQGIYQDRRTDRDDFIVTEVTLQQPSADGLIQVIETHEFYHHLAGPKFAEWSAPEREQNRNSQVKHAGWAILTPEDNLLFFMKAEHNRRNHYYVTLLANAELWTDEPVKQLLLLYHDYPFEPDETTGDNRALIEQVIGEIRMNIRCFSRAGSTG